MLPPEITLQPVILTAVSFGCGVIVGWSTAQDLNSLAAEELRRLMAVFILGLYIVSVLAEIGLGDYSTPILLHGIMGAVVGYLFSQGENFTIDIGN